VNNQSSTIVDRARVDRCRGFRRHTEFASLKSKDVQTVGDSALEPSSTNTSLWVYLAYRCCGNGGTSSVWKTFALTIVNFHHCILC